MASRYTDQGSIQTLTFVKTNQLEWRERKAPRIETAMDAIVRPIAASTCDVDQAIVRGGTPLEGPFSIGHEATARVVDVGSAVTTLKPGDIVSVPWAIACGTCRTCATGLPAHCDVTPSRAMYGHPMGGDWGGLFDDFVRVPFADAMLVKLPAGVDPVEAASVSDNISIAWEVLSSEMAKKPDARILIMGGSASICLYCVDMARALGAKDIVYCDFSSRRLDVAKNYGATVYKSAPNPEWGNFDIVIDASANEKWLHTGLQMVAPEGICDSVGIYFRDVAVPIYEMYMRGTRFRIGRGNARSATPHVLDLMQRKCICPAHVTTARHMWCEAPEMLAASAKPVFVRELELETA
jgi:threonine dehydrogenase-like Zn-dependent dehydrogenase